MGSLVKILLLGPTGSGKSTFVENWYTITGFSSSSITSLTEYPMIFHQKGNNFELIDTPGLFDSDKNKLNRSQVMLNNLSNQLRMTKEINLVILFQKYTGR